MPSGFYRTTGVHWVLTSRNAVVNIHFEEHYTKPTPNKNVETYIKTAQLSKNSLVLWHGPASLFLVMGAASTCDVTPPSGHSPAGDIPKVFLLFVPPNISIILFSFVTSCSLYF